MRKWIGMAAIFASAATLASPRSALVAAGRCDDPDLLEQSKELTRALRVQIAEQLLAPDELMKRLAPSASRLPAELQRQIEGAELQYFAADYAKAEQRVLDALEEVERLQPGAKRWQLLARGALLRALILRATSRPSDADEQFRRVLRLDPDYRLDSDYFPPSTRARFDRVRRQLASEPRATLLVTSNPAGAEVFLDGLALKRTTPISLELVPGQYAVTLSKDGLFSFPRLVELPSFSSAHFDLEFESAFQSKVMPCFADGGDESFRLTTAVKLGSWLGVERVVIARGEQRSAGYTWVSAALVQVATGQKIREGGVKVEASERSSAGLDELAEFISTGKAGRNIVASDFVQNSLPDEPKAAAPTLHSLASGPVREEHGSGPGALGGSSKRWGKVLGAGLVGLGALAVGAGMVFQLRADQWTAELNRHYPEGRPPPLGELGAVQSIRGREDSQRSSAMLSYAIGAAAVSAGVFLFLSRPAISDPNPVVSVHLLPGSVSLAGRWP